MTLISGRRVRRREVLVPLVLFAAFGCSGPASPTSPNQPPVSVAAAAAATNIPPLSGPSRSFVFDRELSFPARDYTKRSRFVLYDTGAFVLEYPSLGDTGYRGAYRETMGGLVFDWEGWSVAGPWAATGTLNGDALTVRYNLTMQLSDFEDAIYLLTK